MSRLDRSRDGSEVPDSDTIEVKREPSTEHDLADEMKATSVSASKDEPLSRSNTPLSTSAKLKTNHSSSASTPSAKSETADEDIKVEDDITNGHESPDIEPVKQKKSARLSKKPPPRVAPLFNDLPDVAEEANRAYQVIDSCIYQNKYLGYTEHAMECDCSEEWGKSYSFR